MTETKFTPGPWRISQGNIGNAIEGQSGKNVHEFDDGFRVLATFQPCEPTGKYLEEQENAKANAHLIAAAPDMYEELECARDVFRFYQSHHEFKGGTEKAIRNKEIADRIDRLLAKARGEA